MSDWQPTTETGQRLKRIHAWIAAWPEIGVDLMELGVAHETVMRMSQHVIDLTGVVVVVTRADGAPPDQPPTA